MTSGDGPPRPSLDEALAACWRALQEGVRDRRSPAHTPVLSTVGLDGRPRSRVVVLREAEPSRRLVRFHTDRRSAKAFEIERDPRVSLLVYDAPAKLQIRLEGSAVLHASGPEAERAWNASRPFSRVCYGIDPGPGSAIGDCDAFALPIEPDLVEAGRSNFMAVIVTIAGVEMLSLRHEGHRRARFEWTGDGELSGTWLAP
jgi:pyridoxamine 5'-phosphate oxidase